jgi:hypothetical protein
MLKTCPWSNPTKNKPTAKTIANATIARIGTALLETLISLD